METLSQGIKQKVDTFSTNLPTKDTQVHKQGEHLHCLMPCKTKAAENLLEGLCIVNGMPFNNVVIKGHAFNLFFCFGMTLVSLESVWNQFEANLGEANDCGSCNTRSCAEEATAKQDG